MVLKFHMQYDQMAGLRNDQIQPGRESKVPAVTKKSETNKIHFSSEQRGIVG